MCKSKINIGDQMSKVILGLQMSSPIHGLIMGTWLFPHKWGPIHFEPQKLQRIYPAKTEIFNFCDWI